MRKKDGSVAALIEIIPFCWKAIRQEGIGGIFQTSQVRLFDEALWMDIGIKGVFGVAVDRICLYLLEAEDLGRRIHEEPGPRHHAGIISQRTDAVPRPEGTFAYTSKDGATARNFPDLEWLATMCSH
ncbi:MAG: hypothetical protein WCK00_02015, partial [Deltaproteobacteria bacterium]